MVNFAAVEARVAASCMRLANTTVTVGALARQGIFERVSTVADGVETTTPTLTLLTSDVAALSIQFGTRVACDGAYAGNYIVRGIEPDGTGQSLLILEAA